MSEVPPRHPAIPVDAVWLNELELWQAGPDAGAASTTTTTATTEVRRYRPDGTLYLVCQVDATGAQNGPFTLYHRDGRVAREGRYDEGRVHGKLIAHAPDSEDGEPLRGCCVPENARFMKAEYDRGDLVYERFFDSADRLLLSDGRLCPDRPPSLPDRASYEEFEDRWCVQPETPASPEPWRFYDQSATLVEEARFEDGIKRWSRLYASDGGVREEVTLGRDSRRHGPYRRRFVDGLTSPYLDSRIVEERGELADDQPVGPWSFHDAEGKVIRAVEHGRTLPADTPGHPVFADQTRLPEAWSELAERLFAEGQPAQALAAAARAAARRGDAGDLIADIARHTRPLTPAEATAAAERAVNVEADPIPALLSALIGGAEPAAIFRALATAQRDTPHAGRDFADAAILLAPDRPMNYLTRSLLRLELGDDRGALSDADRAGAASPESRQFVRDYARLLLPEWGFAPARELSGLEPGPVEGIPEGPCQELAAIHALLGVYATRLGVLREAVLARVPRRASAGFIPPKLPALLPAGPVTLRRYQATIADETDDGQTESTEVEIDETIDPGTAGLPALMRVARGQWAAVTWLCWACGLDQVALPTAIVPRPEFAAAAAAAITRFFRAQDVLTTGGVRSQSAGVPSFQWEGMDVDEMPRPFVQLAVDEYYELRALFLWLLSPENISPFQNDLRQIG
jgi:hypothetical protein